MAQAVHPEIYQKRGNTVYIIDPSQCANPSYTLIVRTGPHSTLRTRPDCAVVGTRCSCSLSSTSAECTGRHDDDGHCHMLVTTLGGIECEITPDERSRLEPLLNTFRRASSRDSGLSLAISEGRVPNEADVRGRDESIWSAEHLHEPVGHEMMVANLLLGDVHAPMPSPSP